MIKKIIFFSLFIVGFSTFSFAQKAPKLAVLAYYTGNDTLIEQYNLSQLTHIIYSFGHIKDGILHLDRKKDTATIEKLVLLKSKYPHLKVMLSMGGWGGCSACSETFSTPESRARFIQSVKDISDYFHLDGFDMDWEYPTIEGFPKHQYAINDKDNFTDLMRRLRATMGKKYELSFAAGGFQHYLDDAVDWKKVMPFVNLVNVMSYDLVSGYATTTGHHTALYSARTQDQSADRAVDYLLKLGIPSHKIVIGAAFYARVWQNVADTNHGLYQSGIFYRGVDYKKYDSAFVATNGWQAFWDDKAQAPYWYNTTARMFATGDDKHSVIMKTKYAIAKKLGGIMFWELPYDLYNDGLLDAIYKAKMGK